jgi:UDP-glucose 4-epimerase
MAFNIFCRAAIADEEVHVFGDGRQTRDFTFVADIVAATRAAAVEPIESGGAYNIGGGLHASVREALTVIEQIAERPLRLVFQGEQAGDVRDTCAEISRAREQLGFSPACSLQAGLAAEFAWLSASQDRDTRGHAYT